MAGLLPKFITDRLPLFGGASDSSSTNANSVSSTKNSNSNNQQQAPKDLDELVDRVMDNSNIDNQTKREILTVVLNNLQHQPDTTSPATINKTHSNNHTNLTNGQHSVGSPMLASFTPSPMYYTPQQSQLPPGLVYYPYQQQQMIPSAGLYYQGPQFNPPMFHPFQPQIQYTPPQNQIEHLAAKVDEISSEMAELIRMIKGEMGTNTRTPHINRIRDMINKLSDVSSSSNQSESSLSDNVSELEPSTLSQLPSKPSGPDSVIDTVGSAINSINTALGLNSESPTETTNNKPKNTTLNESKPKSSEKEADKLSDVDKKILDDEKLAKAANNTAGIIKSTQPGNNDFSQSEKPDNMVDLDQYEPPQDKIDDTIDTQLIDKGLESPTTDNKPGPTMADNKPGPTVADNKPGPTVADNKPGPTVADNKPVNNLATAIGNLNKKAQNQEIQKPVEQVGGSSSKTLKKKKPTSLLSSMANALGLTNTTQKKQKETKNEKRGRPRKNLNYLE